MNTEGKHVIAGVDVASRELVVRISSDSKILRFPNDRKGTRDFVSACKKYEISLVVCEHTGRHEWSLLVALWDSEIPVHCAQPRAVHNFAKARKATGKSDPIDAETIMQYGLRMDLEPTKRPNPRLLELKELTARREDLNGILVQERNRLLAPAISDSITRGIKHHISFLERELKKNEEAIAALVRKEPSLQAPIECLDGIYGVGLVAAAVIYANMPELGTLSRQAAGSLAGLAPIIRESGAFSGKRKISGGRTQVRNALYMVVLSIIRKKDHVLRGFYLRLKKAGKHTSVALTAVMRKTLIYMNSKLKELRALQGQKLPIPA